MLKALFAMMSPRLWGTAATLFLVAIGAALAHADDGIPGNCERQYAAFYRPEIFPRYEPQNQRLVLVNWSTGEEVMILAQGLAAAEFRITGWSPECQYLTGAAGTPDANGVMIWNTLVWDTVNNALIGVFEGARIIPHPVTWDTNSLYLIVETRDGAYLWHIPTGNRIQLTSSSDGNGRSFKPGTLEWDYASSQLHVWLTISPYGGAIYDLNTGQLLGVSDRFGRAMDTTTAYMAQSSDTPYACHSYRYYGNAPNGLKAVYQSYNQRIILMDSGTREVVRVLEENIETTHFDVLSWSPGCRYLAATLGRGSQTTVYVWDYLTGVRVGTLVEMGVPHHGSWSPDGEYMVVSTRNGAYLWHLPTNRQTVLTQSVNVIVYGSGDIYAYTYLEWDMDNKQVRMRHSGYEISYDLTTGQPIRFVNAQGEEVSADSVDAQRVIDRINSPFGCEPSVRYEVYNRRLVLLDWVTHKLVHIIEDNLELAGFWFRGWSPNCRYIAASIRTSNNGTDTVVWDLGTSQRVGAFENAVGKLHQLRWDPSGNFILVETRDGGFLWYLPTNSRYLLTTATDGNGRSFHHVAWDTVRGQVLTVNVDDDTAVHAYDIWSGDEVGYYHTNQRAAVVDFTLSEDGSKIIVFTPETRRLHDGRPSGLAVWERSTGLGVQLEVSGDLKPHRHIGISPDNRYVYISGSYRVDLWDLHSLSGSEPYLPTYQLYPINPGSLAFVGEDVIETTRITATRQQMARRQYTKTYYRYDIRSGELLSEESDIIEYERLDYWYYWYGEGFGA